MDTEYNVNWERYPLRAACCLLYGPDNCILSVSRKTNHEDKGLPGGKCEPGETYMDAAIRELLEETGYLAEDLEPVFMADGDTGLPVDSIDSPKLNSNGKLPCNTVTFLVRKYSKSPASEVTESGLVSWVAPNLISKGSFANYNTNLLKVNCAAELSSLKRDHKFTEGKFVITMFDSYQGRILQLFDTNAYTVPELIEYIIDMWREDTGNHVLPLLSRLQTEPELGMNKAEILYEQYDRMPVDTREKVESIMRSYGDTPELQALFIREIEVERNEAEYAITRYHPDMKSLFAKLQHYTSYSN